jgi:TM2 domain-containing membrane protein YozV
MAPDCPKATLDAHYARCIFHSTRITMATHKNKTLATLLALLFGGIGLHRFYLHGSRDAWGWLHFAALPLSALLVLGQPHAALIFSAGPLVISMLAACIEALVIGLTPDEKWDARHNPASGRRSASGWGVALLLVSTLAVGATGLIAAIARSFDVLLTGGAYG